MLQNHRSDAADNSTAAHRSVRDKDCILIINCMLHELDLYKKLCDVRVYKLFFYKKNVYIKFRNFNALSSIKRNVSCNQEEAEEEI